MTERRAAAAAAESGEASDTPSSRRGRLGTGYMAMGSLKDELLKTIWHAFTALDLDHSGKVSKSQLKVGTPLFGPHLGPRRRAFHYPGVGVRLAGGDHREGRPECGRTACSLGDGRDRDLAPCASLLPSSGALGPVCWSPRGSRCAGEDLVAALRREPGSLLERGARKVLDFLEAVGSSLGQTFQSFLFTPERKGLAQGH